MPAPVDTQHRFHWGTVWLPHAPAYILVPGPRWPIFERPVPAALCGSRGVGYALGSILHMPRCDAGGRLHVLSYTLPQEQSTTHLDPRYLRPGRHAVPYSAGETPPCKKNTPEEAFPLTRTQPSRAHTRWYLPQKAWHIWHKRLKKYGTKYGTKSGTRYVTTPPGHLRNTPRLPPRQG